MMRELVEQGAVVVLAPAEGLWPRHLHKVLASVVERSLAAMT
jgi:hypothetical protein